MEPNPFDIPQSAGPKGPKLRLSWKVPLVFGWVIFLVFLCIFVVWHKVTNDAAQVSPQGNEQVDAGDVALPDLAVASDGLAGSAKDRTLEVNGQLKLNNSLVFDPTDPPSSPVQGQVYYDKTTNVPMYYDGTKFVAVASKQDVEAARQSVQVVDSEQSTAVAVEVPGDIAQTGQSNRFTNNNLFMQDLSVNGFTSLQSTSIASLVLGQPLSVASGGTGASSLAAGGVLLGGGSGAISSVSAGSTGLCLMSTSTTPSFQACPSGGSTPNAVTSTSNATGNLAKFGAGNTIIDSLLSDNGSSVSVAGNLNLGAYNLQLGNSGFGMTLNTTTLMANRSILLPDASGVICLQSSSSCGFVTGTPANFIQNQNTGAQSSTNYWVAGVGRADGGLLGPSFDRATAGILSIGGANATTINIGANDDAHSINIGTGANTDQDIVIGSLSSGSSLTFNTRESFVVNQGPATVFQTGLLGEVYLQAGNDSNGALMVKNASGDNIFRVRETGIYLQRATSVTGNLTPDVNNQYDIGASGLAWRNGYFGTGYYGSGLYSPTLDTSGAGALSIGGVNANTVNIANNPGGHSVSIATGIGSQEVGIGSTSFSSGLLLQGGSLNIDLVSSSSIYNHYDNYFVLADRAGNSHLTVNSANKEIITGYGTALLVDGSFRVRNSTAQFDAGLTITNASGLPSYLTPGGYSLQTAINIPNYTMAQYGTILALGMDRLAPDTARAILVADAREFAHQPTIGVLSQNENEIFGFSWEGGNATGYLKNTASNIGIRVNGTNDVAQFQGSHIYLNQNTNVTGTLQVSGNSVFTPSTDSTDAFKIQGADTSAVLLRADTVANKLVVRELEVTYNLVIGGNLTVGGHFRSLGATPTNSPAAASCTSPTVTVTGNDIAGTLTVVAGSGCGATGEIAAVLFANQFYDTLPTVTITAANAATADLNTFVDSDTMTLSGFDISTTTPLSSGATYKWYYHVIQ